MTPEEKENRAIGQLTIAGAALSTISAAFLSWRAAGIILILWASFFLFCAAHAAVKSNRKERQPPAHTEN